MQLLDGIVGGEGEIVATAVASREFRINAAEAVEGLVDIAEIVDQKAKGVGAAASVIIVVVLQYSLVDGRLLVARLVHQPVNNAWDSTGNVHHVLLEVRVVVHVATLVKVRDIDEVPV